MEKTAIKLILILVLLCSSAFADQVVKVTGTSGALLFPAADVFESANNIATTGSVTAVKAFSIQRANHTGTQTASTISDLSAAVALLQALTISGTIGRTQVTGTALTTTSGDYIKSLTVSGSGILLSSSQGTPTLTLTGSNIDLSGNASDVGALTVLSHPLSYYFGGDAIGQFSAILVGSGTGEVFGSFIGGINGNTITSGSGRLTLQSGATLTVPSSMTLGTSATNPTAFFATASALTSEASTARAAESAAQSTANAALPASRAPIYPETYGAVGDGTTDDTTSIQSAITAAEAVRGVVKLGAKTYRITASLSATSGVTIEGSGVIQLPGSAVSGTANATDSIGLPTQSPFLAGSVLLVTASNTNAINITALGDSVNLKDFGIRFADAIKFTHTGHGVFAQPPILAGHSPKRDNGIQGSVWRNVFVYGHDGNHYAFWKVNGLYNASENLQSWGGGGWVFENNGVVNPSTEEDPLPINQQCGNEIITNVNILTICYGTAHAFYIKNTAGTSGFFSFSRCQGLVFGLNNTWGIPPTSAQSLFWADDGTNNLSILGGCAFETTAGSTMRLPSSMVGLLISGCESLSDQPFALAGATVSGFKSMPMVISSPLSWGPSSGSASGNEMLIRMKDDPNGYYTGIGYNGIYEVMNYMQSTADPRFRWVWGSMNSSKVFTRFNSMSGIDGSIEFGGTNNVLPNQAATSGSSIMTRSLGDARYTLASGGTLTGAAITSSTIGSTNTVSASAITGGTLTIGSVTISGVLPASNGGAGTINGILKANGSGTVSAASAGTDYLTPAGNGAALSGVVTSATSTVPGIAAVVSGGNLTLSGTPRAFVIVSATTGRSNTSTFADDATLQVALTPGTYKYECLAIFRADHYTRGVKTQMAFSGTYTVGNEIAEYDNGSGFVAHQSTYGSITNSVQYATDARWFKRTGTIVVTVTGTISFQWAQVTANSDDTIIIQPGSYLEVTKQ